MKILFVVKNMRLSNGVSSYVMNYYRELNGKEFQFDFLIVSDVGSPYYQEITENGSNVFIMPSYKKHPLKTVSYLNNLFKENNYDIVHSNVFNSGALILMIANKHKVPVRILHSHATQTGDKKWKEIRNKFFCSISLHYANKYFSCSHLAGDYIFRKDNYHVIANAVDIEKYSYNSILRKKIREEKKCTDKFIVMTVGRFTKQKNPYFIVDIINKLKSYNNDVIFWWFGNGAMEDEVKKYAEENNVLDVIEFYGASKKVNEYYSAADIFILPSLYEGLPVVGIEAQVSGLPTLFSNKITKEARISNYTKFLPIESPDIWAEEILGFLKFKREDNLKNINFDEYKIENKSKDLAGIYKSILNEELTKK